MQRRRTAVVSGGGTGIGRGIAQALLDDGYHVVLLGRRAEVLAEAAEALRQTTQTGEVGFHAVDLSDPDATAIAMTQVVAELDGTVDVVVANAGRGAPRVSAELASHAHSWADAIAGNTITTVLLVEAVRPHLSNTGRVIFISSAAATGLGGGAYGGAKAALHAWMLDLAVELGPQGVTCNIVSPGFIDETDLFAGRLTDEGRAAYHVRTLVGRGGLPADVADCVRWLAAPASGYVTAQVIGIDGGSLVNSR
jgi:3-oxoacyl-[acyl-carrier protein] reductase